MPFRIFIADDDPEYRALIEDKLREFEQ